MSQRKQTRPSPGTPMTNLEPFVPRFFPLDVFLDVAHQQAIIILESDRGRLDNESFGQFTRSIVRDRYHSRVGHGRVSQEMCFELGGSDLETLEASVSTAYQRLLIGSAYFNLNQFFDSVNNEDMLCAFRPNSHHSFVSGPNPSILEGLSSRCLVVEIAQNDAWRLDDEFARFVVFGDLRSFD